MFSKGDKVVYPMYGAGIIEELQERTIDGNIREYYVLSIPVGNLKIMISALNASSLGLRDVLEKEEVIRIINDPTELQPITSSENWNQRYKENMERVKTGELDKVVDVFRNLTYREKEKGLSSAEKKILTTVKQILISEIILTQNINKEDAEEMLAESYQNCYN